MTGAGHRTWQTASSSLSLKHLIVSALELHTVCVSISALPWMYFICATTLSIRANGLVGHCWSICEHVCCVYKLCRNSELWTHFFLMLPANSSIHLLPITQLKAERGSWSRSHLTLRDNGLRTEKERKTWTSACGWDDTAPPCWPVCVYSARLSTNIWYIYYGHKGWAQHWSPVNNSFIHFLLLKKLKL